MLGLRCECEKKVLFSQIHQMHTIDSDTEFDTQWKCHPVMVNLTNSWTGIHHTLADSFIARWNFYHL